MTALDDVYNDIKNYPSTYVTIDIIDVNWPGPAINDDDEVEFRFQATNTGMLNMADVQFLVEGLNGTLVKGNGAAATYVDSLTTSAGFFDDLPAHHPDEPVTWATGPIFFKPTRAFPNVAHDLVRVSVAGWSSSWDHVFDNHTEADPNAQDTYSSTVEVG
jgi:hypothetical protein